MLKEVFNLVRVIIKGNKLVRAKSEVDGANPHFGSYLTCNMSFGYPTLGSSLYKDPMRPPFPLNYLIPSLSIITAPA